jgi:hypothetical protein
MFQAPKLPREKAQTCILFLREEYVKTAESGVPRQIQCKRKHRNDAVAKLSVGDWVLYTVVSNKEDDQLWLGQIMFNPVWDGQGVCQNTACGVHFYNSKGLEIDHNEVAMNVVWYEQIGIGCDAMEYQIELTETNMIVQSNTYYISITFELHRVLVRSNPVPKIITSSQPRDSKNLHYHTTANYWLVKDLGLKWKMGKTVFENALGRCGK